MEAKFKTSGKSLIKFLLIIFRSIFFLYVLGLMIYMLVSIISYSTNAEPFHTDLTVMFEFTEAGNLNLHENEWESKFNIHSATGIMGTEDLPFVVTLISTIVSVLISICVLLIIKIICQILEAAHTNNFLITENAVRMRKMAFLFITMFIIDKLYTVTSSFYLSDKLDFTGIEFTSINFYSFVGWEYLFFYLFLWVIAEAFRIGAELKHENDLTI